MSGLVALLAQSGAPVDRQLLHAMTTAQRFRGPDGEATWLEGSVGLGHTLHKTTVEAEREVQPCSLDERLFITSDARVDARQELCVRLRDHGHDVRIDAPDPELLLHAYDVWGEGFLEHLLGDFSFALWDAPRRRLVCAVDHLGVKPFYYANRGELFVGSNSLECVRLHPQVRNNLNEIAVADFLLLGCYLDRDVTIYADIARIPPGHFLVVDAAGLRLQRYFSLPQPVEVRLRRQDDYVEQFQELLDRAVQDRLRTPRIAVYMSGGVDSSLVAMTAKRELDRLFANHALEAFACVYDRLIPDDERYYAGLVASSLGIPVDFQSLDDGEFFDWLGRAAPAEPMDAPAYASQLRQISRLSEGFSTVLTGWDGDGLMRAATGLHWSERLHQHRFGALVQELTWYVRHERALPPIGLRTRLARLRRGRQGRARPSWLQESFCERTGALERWEMALAPPVFARSREPCFVNFASPTLERIFDSYDAGCLRFALDVRHPLADLRIIRFALGLPAVPWCVDKHLLRRCLRGMPEAVRTRPKTRLQGDPHLERFRAGGLGHVRTLWQANGALDQFMDTAAVSQALESHAAPPVQLSLLLRAVALGVWFTARNGSGTDRPVLASPECLPAFNHATI